jgi:mannose-6-phosphate isomerase-like protein (cupin superfamily)
MLIENWNVEKLHFPGLIYQSLAGSQEGLKTLQVWLITLEPGGYAIPPFEHVGEVVAVTLKGSGCALVGDQSFELRPNTTLIIPPHATRQVMNNGTEDLVALVIRSLSRLTEE